MNLMARICARALLDIAAVALFVARFTQRGAVLALERASRASGGKGEKP